MIKTTNMVSSVSRRAGGLYYSVRRLAQSMAELGLVDVEVMSLEDEFSPEDVTDWMPLKPRLYPVAGPRAFGYSMGLREAVLGSDMALLHSHGLWMFPSKLSLEWSRRRRRPYLISPHGMLDPWALKHSRFKKAVASFLFENDNLKGAACIRSLCASETEAVRSLGLGRPICQIPNGVDVPEDGPGGPAPWSRQLKESDKVLLYLGRIHPKKGLANLVEAFSRLNREGKVPQHSWYLVIAGWDQAGHEDQLKQMARELKMESRILFPGPLFNQEKAAAFRHATAFILPSFSEGLPVAVLEAWAYGLPVLATKECNLPEGFEKGAAMRIPTDADGIRAGLEDLFSLGPEDLREMGRKGRALVKVKFTWNRVAKDMVSVYFWLLGSGPKPACVVA